METNQEVKIIKPKRPTEKKPKKQKAKKEESAFDKLSPKHKEFLKNYIELLNAKKAYQKAYPTSSDLNSETSGPRLLRNAQVDAALKEYYADLWKKKDDYIGVMFKNLLSIIEFDISDYVDENGDIDLKSIRQKKSFAISEIRKTVNETKYGTNTNNGIKAHDKLKAISEMTKILGMIQEKILVSYDADSVKELQDLFNEQISGSKNN